MTRSMAVQNGLAYTHIGNDYSKEPRRGASVHRRTGEDRGRQAAGSN
jgi:hypothetical protein